MEPAPSPIAYSMDCIDRTVFFFSNAEIEVSVCGVKASLNNFCSGERYRLSQSLPYYATFASKQSLCILALLNADIPEVGM